VVALRGTASTGFRAPSLQQQYFTSTASVLSNGVIVETGTFPSVSAVAASLGGVALRPEKSFNLSAGTVLRAGGFDLTVDGYIIKVRDQLGLSENITLSSAAQTLYGVQAARFFVNGLHTTTKGIDIVGHYKLRTDTVGTFDLTASANFNTLSVDDPHLVAGHPVRPSAHPDHHQGTPGEKVVGSVDWSKGKAGATVRATYYGNVNQPGSTAAGDIYTGRHTMTDIERATRCCRRPRCRWARTTCSTSIPTRCPPRCWPPMAAWPSRSSRPSASTGASFTPS
jgi:iron complex outermembrane receptor protein